MMFIMGSIGGLIAHSIGLMADSLGMLAGAMAFGTALGDWSPTAGFHASAAQIRGTLLLVLGIGVLFAALWRLVAGSSPDGVLMMGVAFASLLVKATVIGLLQRFSNGADRLRAKLLFSRTDVVESLAVIASGGLVCLLNSPLPDLLIGLIISRFVIKQALEIRRASRRG